MNNLKDMRLIYVEDEPLIALDTEIMLRDIGFDHVTLCHTFDQAMSEIESNTFDVAVLDLNLNGRNSSALAERLIAKGSQVIFTTGYSRGEELPGGIEADLIGKPFERADLETALKRATERM